jgi:hypothetical protein
MALCSCVHILVNRFLKKLSASSSATKGFDLTGSLLPEVFPDGDPSQYALPVFLQEPKDAFTAKGVPAKLGKSTF